MLVAAHDELACGEALAFTLVQGSLCELAAEGREEQ